MKCTWARFSLRNSLIGITLLCVVLVFRKFTVLGALVGVAAAMAGMVAFFVQVGVRSFFIGGVLGSYGCIVFFILGDFLGQVLFSVGIARSYVLLPSAFVGLLLGALATGFIERKYRQVHIPHD